MPCLGRFTLRDQGKQPFIYLGLSAMERLLELNRPKSCSRSNKSNSQEIRRRRRKCRTLLKSLPTPRLAQRIDLSQNTSSNHSLFFSHQGLRFMGDRLKPIRLSFPSDTLYLPTLSMQQSSRSWEDWGALYVNPLLVSLSRYPYLFLRNVSLFESRNTLILCNLCGIIAFLFLLPCLRADAEDG